MTTLLGITTESTCAEACWHAREDVCRCACGGAQHGVLNDPDNPRPKRTRRVGFYRYEFEAVALGYGDAHRYCRDRGVHRPGDKGRALMAQSAPDRVFGKWPELDGFKPDMDFQKHPYIIWRRVA